MRLSNDFNDLRTFLSNPAQNIDLCWTELEDKIILENIKKKKNIKFLKK